MATKSEPSVNTENKEIEVIESTTKHYDDKNESIVTGTLIYRRDLNTFSILSVLTTTGRNRDITSTITVRVPNTISLEGIELKNRITVKGHLRCRPVKNREDENARPTHEPYIQATSVEITKSDMEEAFGIKGRAFGDSYNKTFLTGTVAKMVQSNRNTVRLTLSIKEPGEKERFIEAVFYTRNNSKMILPLVAAGNRICAVAEVQNYKKDPGKSYTISGKTVVRKEEVAPQPGESIYVKNIVLLDVNEV